MNTPEWGNPGIWKFVAGVCVTIIVVGAPGMVYAIRTWSVAEHVQKVQDRQEETQNRIAVLETQNTFLAGEVARLRMDLEEHRQTDQQGG